MKWNVTRALVAQAINREEKKAIIKSLENQWQNLKKHDNARALEIMVSWIRETFLYTGAKGILLGISGGINSTLGAILLARALPPEKTLLFYIPCGDFMAQDDEDTKKLASILKLPLKTVDIKTIVGTFIRQMAIKNPDKKVIGNLMNKIRTAAMYYEGDTKNYLVMDSADMDVSYIGYWPKAASCDISPIKSLHKSEIRKLIHLALSPYDEKFANYMASKESTPGYWPGQKAEDEIGVSYNKIEEAIKIILHTCKIHDTGVTPLNAGAMEKELKKSSLSEIEFFNITNLICENYYKSHNSTLYNTSKYERVSRDEDGPKIGL